MKVIEVIVTVLDVIMAVLVSWYPVTWVWVWVWVRVWCDVRSALFF